MVSVELLKSQDEAAWRELWHGYNVFYERADKVSEEATATLWRKIHDPKSIIIGYGAYQDGRLVGFTHAFPHESTAEPAGKLYLQDLFVAPDVRSGGHGEALIHAVYELGEQMGVAQVYWMTQDFNATARRLYDKVGTLTPFIKYCR